MTNRFSINAQSILFIVSVVFSLASLSLKAVDLSGVEMKNISEPVSGLFSGGQPSENDLKLLAERGVKNIINLRADGEFTEFDEASKASSYQLNYISLPVNGAADVTLENAEKLDAYLKDLKGDTVIHCASGNRVGALLALRAGLLQGVELEKAIALGKSAGMSSLEAKTREMLQAGQLE